MDDYDFEFELRAADLLADAIGDPAAAALIRRLNGYSNLPNTVKGASKLPADPVIEQVALRCFDDAELVARTVDGYSQILWGLLALAARADIEVLDRVAPAIPDRHGDKVRMIRRAAAKHDPHPAPPTVPRAGDVVLPTKLSEVKRWLAAHPDVDPTVLAPRSAQTAAQRRAAIRALGAIGTDDALRVLAGYAQDAYPEADLAELHRAWGRFDRREFAAAMFSSSPFILRLGACSSIEGIGAVAGLRGLDVTFLDHVDLTPLVECQTLDHVQVHVTDRAIVTSVEPLTQLPLLRELHLIGRTGTADLTVLARTPVERLYIHLEGADGEFLAAMPHLHSLKVASDAEGPAAAAFAAVLVGLASRGVQVVMYRHQKALVSAVMAAAPTDLTVVESNGLVGLIRDESQADRLRGRLRSNLPP